MSDYRTATYHLAPSLVELFNEIDARWPNRSKASDGWIGDASHAARVSDHNPDYKVGGVIRAIDVTRQGIDVDALLAAVVRDERVWYVITNRRIASRTYGWVWKPYDGANPHLEHVHISIEHTRPAETGTAKWFTSPGKTPGKTSPAKPEVPEMLSDADKLWMRAQMDDAISDYMARFWTAPTGTGTALRAKVDEIESKLGDKS